MMAKDSDWFKTSSIVQTFEEKLNRARANLDKISEERDQYQKEATLLTTSHAEDKIAMTAELNSEQQKSSLLQREVDSLKTDMARLKDEMRKSSV